MGMMRPETRLLYKRKRDGVVGCGPREVGQSGARPLARPSGRPETVRRPKSGPTADKE